MTALNRRTFGKEVWAQGTRGEGDPHGDRAFIENMHTYTDGALGIRSKWKMVWEDPSTEQYTNYSKVRGAWNAAPSDFILRNGDDGVSVVRLSDDTELWSWSASTMNDTVANHFIDAQASLARVLFVFNQEGVAVPPATPTSTTIPIHTDYSYSSSSVVTALIWQGRAWYLVYGYDTGTAVIPISNRIIYTDLYDFDAFTDSGYFDLDIDTLAGLVVVDNDLMTYNEDGRWFRLTSGGGPVTSMSVTPWVDGRVPSEGRYITVDGATFFLSGPYYADPRVTVVTSRGLDDESLKHLRPKAHYSAPDYVQMEIPAGSSVNNCVWLPWRETTGVDTKAGKLDLYGYVFYDGAWWNDKSLHLDVDTAGDYEIAGTTMDWDSEAIMVCWVTWNDGGGTYSTEAHMYTRDISLDRPSNNNDTWSDRAENTNVAGTNAEWSEFGQGKVILPRLAGEAHQYVRIRKVTVDFKYWQSTDIYADVSLDISVQDQEGNDTTFTKDNDLTALSDATPGYLRVEASVDGMPFTPWCEVTLDGIDSLAIESVHVDYEIEDRAW